MNISKCDGDLTKICSSLAAKGYSVRFRGFNAIDKYLELPDLPFFCIETNADISVLARFMENLRFPGIDIADGAADTSDGTCYFHCLDSDVQNEDAFSLLSFSYDLQSGRFQDPLGFYPLLREIRNKREHFLEDDCTEIAALPGRYRTIMDAALFLARYGISVENGEALAPALRPPPEMQRAFLCCLLVSPRPDLGLELLKRSGFIKEFWPELAGLDDVDHSKEFHPEGNVWNHTLETFRYRKAAGSGAFDLRLSLGLLLHDMGKPVSASFGSRRFDGHAELGARAATRFLERLEFEASFVQDVFYLVRNHMLPAALKRLPLTKTGEIMASPMFPSLMELYRCDESSSFKGLDGYYENSAAYQAYLKNIKNPYRSADGKKMKTLKRPC